jgi:hypothetical protein
MGKPVCKKLKPGCAVKLLENSAREKHENNPERNILIWFM